MNKYAWLARRYLWTKEYAHLRLALTRVHGRSRRYAGVLWAWRRAGHPMDRIDASFLAARNTAYVVVGRYEEAVFPSRPRP